MEEAVAEGLGVAVADGAVVGLTVAVARTVAEGFGVEVPGGGGRATLGVVDAAFRSGVAVPVTVSVRPGASVGVAAVSPVA